MFLLSTLSIRGSKKEKVNKGFIALDMFHNCFTWNISRLITLIDNEGVVLMVKIVDHVSENLSNGNTIHYQITDSGTAYHKETSQKVVDVLENARTMRKRVRVFYGDTQTGESWLDEYDTMGTIGRSTGQIKIPLLIKNANSTGGGAILDHCIIRIVDLGNKYDLYKHPNFHVGEFKVRKVDMTAHDKHYTAGVYHNKKGNLANFEKMEQAERWVKFISGERNSK